MKILTGFATSLLLALSLHGAQPTLPTSSEYEELPELKASEILRDTILKGPHHQVREEVTTESGQIGSRSNRTLEFLLRKETRCWRGASTRSTPSDG
jgi:hypothetical protein